MMFFRAYKTGYFLFAFLLNIFLLNNCTKKEKLPVYRFIDHFSQKNILSSPFQEFARDPQAFKRTNAAVYEIADKHPLYDFKSGENPFLIKKKLPIGLVDINALLAPPKSHYKFPLKIPDNSILEFTFGILRDSELAEKKEGTRSVRFSIILWIKERKVELFTRTLVLHPNQNFVFDYKKINLSDYSGKDAIFYFSTSGTKKALACWLNPVIYVPTQYPRNVILISLDTLRPDHLGCYGYLRETSPNIDTLAKDSALFINTFAPSPWTLPSHVSLLTSLNCINHQVYHVDQKMDPAILTLADYLRKKGYFNAGFTGGGYVSGLYGFSKGFDSYHMRGRVQAANSADVICQASLDWIERHQDRNFFLFLHTYQIHNPYFSPPPYNELFLKENAEYKQIDMSLLRFTHENRYKPISDHFKHNIIGLYDGEIRYTDEVFVKPLFSKLKELNIYDNTMIILTSDHGEEFYEHKGWQHTHNVYNETIKVPLIIKFFHSEYAGKKIKKFARLIDIMPTILDVLDIDHSEYFMDGKSLLDLLKHKHESGEEERIFLSELAANAAKNRIPKRVAINQGKNKIILNEDFTPEQLSYFLFPPTQTEKLEVFNLQKDSLEQINLSQTKPGLTRQLLDFMTQNYKKLKEGTSKKTKIDKRIEEQLKALGYIR